METASVKVFLVIIVAAVCLPPIIMLISWLRISGAKSILIIAVISAIIGLTVKHLYF